MERKIVDIMQDINPEMLEDVDLTENEINDLSSGADMERIRCAAYKKISTTTGRKYWRKRSRLQVAVAAILVICLSGTAFAIHQWYMEDFFGKNSEVPEERLDRVLESKVSDGVRMTLAEVIAGEEDANVIIYFERENGEPFSENADVGGLDINFSKAFDGQQASIDIMVKMLENNHKLAYCCNISSFQSILGETLNIEAGTIFNRKVQKEVLDINLSEQFLAYPIRIKSADIDQSKGDLEDYVFEEKARSQTAVAGNVTMPLADKYPELLFAGVGFFDGELGIVTYIEPDRGGANAIEASISAQTRNTAHITELKDSRTGEVYQTEKSSESGGPTSELNFAVTYFKGLTENDLPYLVPVVEYDLPQVISDGRWNFNYTFEKEESWKSANVDSTIDIAAGRLRVTRVSASTLGITVQGEWVERKKNANNRWLPEDDISVKAVMKDGSVKELGLISSQTHYKGVFYKALYGIIPKNRENAWQKQFLDDGMVENIETITIDDKTIPVQ